MCVPLRTIVTRLRKWIWSWTTSGNPSPPPASIYLPCDVLLHMSQYLQFEDYRNLIEAFWPDGGEDELIRQRLWDLSTRTCSPPFFNAKQIEYNYDARRPEQCRILLNVNTLLPITGPIFSTDTDELWISPLEVRDIVWSCYTMDMCSDYRYTSCHCSARPHGTIIEHLQTISELHGTDCPHGHLHHFCTQHISAWLMNYLLPAIQVQEARRAKTIARTSKSFINMLLRFMENIETAVTVTVSRVRR